MNTHTIVADIRQDMSKLRGDIGSQNQLVSGTFQRFSIPTDRSPDSEQVSNFDYREVRI